MRENSACRLSLKVNEVVRSSLSKFRRMFTSTSPTFQLRPVQMKMLLAQSTAQSTAKRRRERRKCKSEGRDLPNPLVSRGEERGCKKRIVTMVLRQKVRAKIRTRFFAKKHESHEQPCSPTHFRVTSWFIKHRVHIHSLRSTDEVMATRRIISSEKTILEKDDKDFSQPAGEKSSIAPAVPA